MNSLERIAAVAALSAGIVAGCSGMPEVAQGVDHAEEPTVQSIDVYSISSPPGIEQFSPCDTDPQAVYVDLTDKQENRLGQIPWAVSIEHVVSESDTVSSIASCYFEQPELGIRSLLAANGVDLNHLKASDVLRINLSLAMSFEVPDNATPKEIAVETGLRLPLVKVMFETHTLPEFVMLPKQAPCVTGGLYHVVQPGESYESIGVIYDNVPDDIYGANAILPQNLQPGHILEIPNLTDKVPGTFQPPSGGFWCD